MTAGHDAPSRQRRAVVLDVVGLLARLGLGVVWLLSGIPKAANPRDTIVAVRAYDLLPRSLVRAGRRRSCPSSRSRWDCC